MSVPGWTRYLSQNQCFEISSAPTAKTIPSHVYLHTRSCVLKPQRNCLSCAEKLNGKVGKPVLWETLSFKEMSSNWNLCEGPKLSDLFCGLRLIPLGSLVNTICYLPSGSQACQKFWWFKGAMHCFLAG